MQIYAELPGKAKFRRFGAIVTTNSAFVEAKIQENRLRETRAFLSFAKF